jgi:hypothetical protein
MTRERPGWYVSLMVKDNNIDTTHPCGKMKRMIKKWRTSWDADEMRLEEKMIDHESTCETCKVHLVTWKLTR